MKKRALSRTHAFIYLYSEFQVLLCLFKEFRLSLTIPKRQNISFQKLKLLSFYRFYIKTHGTKAVVARNHCAMRIFHPAVEKIATAVCKFQNELLDASPCALAHAFGHFSAPAHENVADLHVARMLDGILIRIDKVFMFNFSHRSDFHVFHIFSPNEVYPDKLRFVNYASDKNADELSEVQKKHKNICLKETMLQK